MKKEPKNLGISKACPSCHKIVVRDINIEGEGKLKTKCPHCKELVLLEITKKIVVNVIKISVVVLITIGLYTILFESAKEFVQIEWFE